MNKRQTNYIKTLVKLYAVQGDTFPIPQDKTLKDIIESINSYIKQAKDGK